VRVLLPLFIGLHVFGPLLGHQLGHPLGLVLLATAHAGPELRVNQFGGLKGLRTKTTGSCYGSIPHARTPET